MATLPHHLGVSFTGLSFVLGGSEFPGEARRSRSWWSGRTGCCEPCLPLQPLTLLACCSWSAQSGSCI